MMARPVKAHPSVALSPATRPDAPDSRPHEGARREQAAAELLRYGMLSHTFGDQEEYEVRTTIATRQTWCYRCAVFRHGQEITRAFVHTRQMPHVRHENAGLNTLRLRFALDAVDVHFARCAALQDYSLRAAIDRSPSPPPADYRRRYATRMLCIGAALLMAYGFWKSGPRTTSGPSLGNPPASVQEVHDPVGNRPPVEPHVSVPLPASSRVASRDFPAEPTRAPTLPRLEGTPTAIRLRDLLALEAPERGDPATWTSPPRGPQRRPASAVQAGDLLRLTGWIHRIARDADGTYHLQLRPSREAGAPSLRAVVPPADQAAGAPAVRAQLQAVRAFITQRLLRQQEPSPRGAVLQHPPFVQLTGQLSSPDTLQGEPPQRTELRDPTARWEVRPVLAIQFAPPPVPSDRARAE
jgi:hypothetical protein